MLNLIIENDNQVSLSHQVTKAITLVIHIVHFVTQFTSMRQCEVWLSFLKWYLRFVNVTHYITQLY